MRLKSKIRSACPSTMAYAREKKSGRKTFSNERTDTGRASFRRKSGHPPVAPAKRSMRGGRLSHPKRTYYHSRSECTPNSRPSCRARSNQQYPPCRQTRPSCATPSGRDSSVRRSYPSRSRSGDFRPARGELRWLNDTPPSAVKSAHTPWLSAVPT